MQRPPAALVIPLFVLMALALAFVVRGVLAPPTEADRVERIAEQLRCPVCDGESVAQSDSQASLRMRQEIATRIERGESDRQILQHFADDYGTWILNAPPASGWLRLAWLAPALVLLGGGVGAAAWLRGASPGARGGGGGEDPGPKGAGAPVPAKLKDYL